MVQIDTVENIQYMFINKIKCINHEKVVLQWHQRYYYIAEVYHQ